MGSTIRFSTKPSPSHGSGLRAGRTESERPQPMSAQGDHAQTWRRNHAVPASCAQLALQLADAPVDTYQIVSLFSGCGGMDLGFLGGFPFGGKFYDRLPFDVVWANDLDDRACDTYALNFGHTHLHRGDIADVMDTLPESADLVIGGFPCQDVSINGQLSAQNGERTVLYRKMIEVIERCNPRAFIAENVKGLLMSHGKPFFDQMLADFAATGFNVTHHLYLAADYAVPQMRERVFIIGVKGDTPFAHPDILDERMSAQEALQDLEEIEKNPSISHIWSRAQRSPDQGERQLKADKPATTIRAEHHGNIQFHYKLDRRISLREAARLQSFPDAFAFASAMRATERQIGNAVPPVLAWHIAKAVREHLEQDADGFGVEAKYSKRDIWHSVANSDILFQRSG